ncbi:MAG: serine/threonine-protein kinase, partial [Polyangiaceae bacterium]
MLRPGDAFERYTIEALIGQGGMGCVYRAYDPRLGRRVALKVISEGSAHAPAAANARLVREARAAAAFDHPNAVAIFDVGEREGAPYIVMELVEGRTLRRAAGDAALPVPARIAQLSGVALALAAAHKRGLVHRDIK